MDCVTCGRELPANAVFCIYCAAPIDPPKPADIGLSEAPATGATIRLDPATHPTVPEPAASPKPHHAARPAKPRKAHGRPHSQRHTDLSTPLFLIGLVLLFWSGRFWPGILLLLGFTYFVKEASYGRQARAIKHLLFLAGLALIFFAHAFWPGVIILIISSQVANHRRGFGCQP